MRASCNIQDGKERKISVAACNEKAVAFANAPDGNEDR